MTTGLWLTWGFLLGFLSVGAFAATPAERASLQEALSYYRSRANASMDRDGLCIPLAGQAARAEKLSQLAQAFSDAPDELLPLLEEALSRDPGPEVRGVAYTAFRALPPKERELWAAAAFENLGDSRRPSNRMEDSLCYRAALAVGATHFGVPASQWIVKPEIVADMGNIQRALRIEGFEVDLDFQFARFHSEPSDPDCVRALLEGWSIEGGTGSPLQPTESRR